ncbi:hypothetical protein [Streptomyces sp. C]|uniref:hypothetical protein n=1 Tax=Streptomyces sp. C TaxID=253839 RepID=UPI001F514353|nr:hypothetical protein [Streptomyces sp. C]
MSLLNNPAVGAVCFPSGQVGSGNTFNGTQNINCSQSTSQSVTNPTPPADGGVTGREEVFASSPAPIQPGQRGGASVQCPEGKISTGGGHQLFPFGFDGRVLPDSAANPAPPPFFADLVGTPHSVVTAHLVDEAGHPTLRARDAILTFLTDRLHPHTARHAT